VVLGGWRGGVGDPIFVLTGWREAVESTDNEGQWVTTIVLGDNAFGVRWCQNGGGVGGGEVRERSRPLFIGRGGGPAR
jgi:hypothetical protein